MSRRDREAWEAQLAADPALRAAWEDFRRSLAVASGQIVDGDDPNLADVRRAADDVMTEAGGNQSHH